MGEDEVDFSTVTTSRTINMFMSTDPEDLICVHTAVLLKEHLLKVGYEQPITIGIEEEHGEYDPSSQKVIIIAETRVEE